MKVSIIKQSNNESIVLSNVDVTIIGRGVFGIDDKRISKHHGEITVLDNQIKIKSCHKNPIFIKKGSEASEILDLNAEINLNNDDCFLLLPDDFEFKVKIENSANDQVESSSSTSGPFRIREIAEINDNLEAGAMPVTLSQILRDLPDEDTAQPQVTSSSSSRKRSIESEIAEEPKKIKIEPQEVTDTASTSADANSTTKVDSKINPDSTNPQLPSTSNIKQEPDSSNVKTECTTNDPPPAQSVRPSCSHGIRCFRNNAEHRRDFAHPGDNEYRRPEYPQAAPNAPRCPYWEACYRRNPDHFHMFEHPPSSVYNPNQQPPPVIPPVQPHRRVINVQIYNDYDDDDDMDDEEDIFQNSDDTDVDADYEINGESESDNISEDENNLEE